MKELFTRPSFLQKLEFWGATVIFVFALFFLNTGSLDSNQDLFQKAGLRFKYYRHFVFPEMVQYTVIYLAFLFLNFKVLPRLIEKEHLVKNILLVVLTFVVTGALLGMTNTYLQAYVFVKYQYQDDAYQHIFLQSYSRAFALLLMLGLYTFVKFASLYLIANSEALQNRYKLLTKDTLSAIIIWMVSIVLMLMVEAEDDMILAWAFCGPFGILFYCVSFYRLLPKTAGKKRPFLTYVGLSLLWLVISFFPLAFFMLMLMQNEDDALGLAAGNGFFQLFVTVPLCWYLYKRQQQGHEQVQVLQNELGRSNANLDFLRSQINPHFLFNTLNTLYGTA
ncbi:MAG: histidine kinase, partial [Rufibacter sp.]